MGETTPHASVSAPSGIGPNLVRVFFIYANRVKPYDYGLL